MEQEIEQEDKSNNRQEPKSIEDFGHLFSGSFLMATGYIVSYFFGSRNEDGAYWKIPLLYTAVLIALLIPFSKRLKNIYTFSILLWLLLAIFPLIHYLHFSSNQENYFYEQLYLERNVKNMVKNIPDLENKEKIESIIHTTPDSILKKDLITFGKQLTFTDSFIFKVDNNKKLKNNDPRHPAPTPASVVNIYNKDGSQALQLYFFETSTISDLIEKHKAEHDKDPKHLIEPKKNLTFKPFWLESISGFTFGNIKPASDFSMILRVLQLIIAFVFIAMINNTLRETGRFVLKKKDISTISLNN